MELSSIDLSSWTLTGGGMTSDTYFKDDDPSLMLKVYKPFVSFSLIEEEYKRTNLAVSVGLNVPKCLKMVKVNDSTGLIFERIPNKVSFTKLMSECDESELEGLVKRFAVEAKKMHEAIDKDGILPKRKDLVKEMIDSFTYTAEKNKDKLRGLLQRIPSQNTILHGDFHMSNFVSSLDKTFIIDIGDISTGHPYFDLACMYFLLVYSGSKGGSATKMFRMDSPRLLLIWELFIKHYFGVTSKKEIEEKTSEIRPFALFQALQFSSVRGFTGSVKKAFEEIIEEI